MLQFVHRRLCENCHCSRLNWTFTGTYSLKWAFLILNPEQKKKRMCSCQDCNFPYSAILSHPFSSLEIILYIRSHWTQHVVICRSIDVVCGWIWKKKKQTFLASHFCRTRLFDTVSLINVRLYQNKMSHLINFPHSVLKYIASSTKQSHTWIGNEVPRGHTYIKTRIIILLHAALTLSSFSAYCELWQGRLVDLWVKLSVINLLFSQL